MEVLPLGPFCQASRAGGRGMYLAAPAAPPQLVVLLRPGEVNVIERTGLSGLGGWVGNDVVRLFRFLRGGFFERLGACFLSCFLSFSVWGVWVVCGVSGFSVLGFRVV